MFYLDVFRVIQSVIVIFFVLFIYLFVCMYFTIYLYIPHLTTAASVLSLKIVFSHTLQNYFLIKNNNSETNFILISESSRLRYNDYWRKTRRTRHGHIHIRYTRREPSWTGEYDGFRENSIVLYYVLHVSYMIKNR